MRFGIREICEVVFRAKGMQYLGNRKFYKGEPVLYFDTLKTSSLEGASTTVYATGGRGNTRLVAWEGERTLTFNMEDALLSPESFSILSGAGLLDASEAKPIYVHTTHRYEVKETNTIELPDLACWNGFKDHSNEYYHNAADIFVMTLKDGEVNAEPCLPVEVVHEGDKTVLTCYSHNGVLPIGTIVLVDYYVKRISGAQLIEITADKFGGNYYIEASTLFRDEKSGMDMPAEFIIPNAKVQSNFTFTMAATGDPSTFNFVLDAFPDYTKFDQTHKVLAAIQVITDSIDDAEDTRKPCSEKVTTYESDDADVEVTFAESGNAAATLVATGEVTGQAFDTTLYPNLTDVKAVSMNLKFPIEADETAYKLVAKNPVNKRYPNDSHITGDVKTFETITGKELEDGLTILLTNIDYDTIAKAGPDVTVTLSKINGDFNKTYTIENKLDFEDAATAVTGRANRTTTPQVEE